MTTETITTITVIDDNAISVSLDEVAPVVVVPTEIPTNVTVVPINAEIVSHDVPPGGAAGYVLAKASVADFDLAWVAPGVDPTVVHLTGAELITGAKTFQATDSDTTPLTVQGVVGQAADLTDWLDSDGNPIAYVLPDGGMGVPYIGDTTSRLNSSVMFSAAFSPENALYSNAAAHIVLRVQGAAAQSADLTEWRNSAGTVVASVGPSGALWVKSGTATSYFGPSNTIFGTQLAVQPADPNSSALVLRGAASQFANLQEWQSNGGGVLAKIRSDGGLTISSASLETRYAYFGVTGGGSYVAPAVVASVAGGPAEVPFVAKKAPSQTADIQQWQETDGSILARIDPGGKLTTTQLIVADPGGTDGVVVYRPADQAATHTAVWVPIANASAIGLIVRGAVSQSADLQQWQDNAGSPLTRVLTNGSININRVDTAVIDAGVPLAIQAVASYAGIIVRAQSGQTADLQQWQNSSGGAIALVAANGNIVSAGDIQANGTFYGSAEVITASGPAITPIIAKAAIGQLADMQQWQDSSGFVRAHIDGNYVFASTAGIQAGSADFSGVAWSGISTPAGVTYLPSLVVKAIASQTADLQQWHKSDGTVGSRIGVDGTIFTVTSGVFVNTDFATTPAQFAVVPNNATLPGITVRGAASQIADLQRWEDSAGGRLAFVRNDGLIGAKYVSDSADTGPYFDFLSGQQIGLYARGGTSGVAPFKVDNGPGNIASPVVDIVGRSGQTADLTRWLDSVGNVMVRIASFGALYTDESKVQLYPGPAGRTVSGVTALFVPPSNITTGLIVQGNVSQSEDLQRWRDSDSATLARLDATGSLYTINAVVAGGAAYLGGAISAQPLVTTANAIVARGLASQTGDLQQWQDSAGVVLARITSGGNFSTPGLLSAGPQDFLGATLNASSVGAVSPVVIVRGAPSQSADLLDFQNSGGSTVMGIASDGSLYSGARGVFGFLGDFSGAALQAQPLSASGSALVLRAKPSQTGNLQQWQDSAGTVLGLVDSAGGLYMPLVNAGLPAYASARMATQPLFASEMALVVRGFASQTADLQQWQDSTGAVLSQVKADGTIWVGGTQLGAGGGAVSSVAGRTGAVVLTAADVATGTFPGDYAFSSSSDGVLHLSGGGSPDGTAFIYGTIGVTQKFRINRDGSYHGTWLELRGGGDVQSGAATFSVDTDGSVFAANNLLSSTAVYARAASVGYAGIVVGDATHSGHLDFYSAAGTRQGYIGFSTTTAATDAGTIPYFAATHAFTGAITATGNISENGNRVYSAGNANLATATPATTVFGGAGAVGAGTAYARDNHVHPIGQAYQTLQAAGAAQTQRPIVNFIQGAGATLTIADNAGSTRTDVTIAANVVTVAGRTGAVALTAADIAAGTFPGAMAFTSAPTFSDGTQYTAEATPSSPTDGRVYYDSTQHDLQWYSSAAAAFVSADGTRITTQTVAYTAKNNDVVLANATGGAFAVTLPAVGANIRVTIKKIDSSTNAVTVTPASGTIDGNATWLLTQQYDSITVVSDGTNWLVI